MLFSTKNIQSFRKLYNLYTYAKRINLLFRHLLIDTLALNCTAKCRLKSEKWKLYTSLTCAILCNSATYYLIASNPDLQLETLTTKHKLTL